jgi:hypothetical protein
MGPYQCLYRWRVASLGSRQDQVVLDIEVGAPFSHPNTCVSPGLFPRLAQKSDHAGTARILEETGVKTVIGFEPFQSVLGLCHLSQ